MSTTPANPYADAFACEKGDTDGCARYQAKIAAVHAELAAEKRRDDAIEGVTVAAAAIAVLLIVAWTARWAYRRAQPIHHRYQRIALLAFPFFAVLAIFRINYELDDRGTPSTFGLALSMLALMCLLLAFTRLGGWVKGGK